LKSSIITYSKSKNLNYSILIGDALLEFFDDILCLPASIPSPTIKNSRFCALKQEVKQIIWFEQMTKQQHHHLHHSSIRSSRRRSIMETVKPTVPFFLSRNCSVKTHARFFAILAGWMRVDDSSS
jgi:hypothetical protein